MQKKCDYRSIAKAEVTTTWAQEITRSLGILSIPLLYYVSVIGARKQAVGENKQRI